MTLKLNLGQIDNAAKGNNDLRETLTGIYNEFRAIYRQTGSGPIQKVDAAAVKFNAPPPASSFTVTGANGQFNISIVLPQQAGGNRAPKNPTNAQIYQELSSSPVADFSSDVTVYPLSANTQYVFPNPGAALYWRLRSSYDQKTFNGYARYGGAVNAGLQSSAATQPNVPLNQSNFATVDSIGAGGAATVRIYGSGGVGSSWPSILGASSKVIPGGTILNVPYSTNAFVAWDGSQYHLKSILTQTFSDGWIPVGNVSVIANGSGLVLPTFKAIVSGGAIVAIQILTVGNGLTSVPVITITDSSGTGATAVCTVNAGSVTGIVVTNSGSGYTSSPTVTASGGVSGGAAGGGGNTGSNGGRLFGLTV
ncbi:MAG: hypothetical protein KGL39_35660 [Patescibacteria group bacterium]|nr:hypothetical protein [Patescibacteria group bacterium]